VLSEHVLQELTRTLTDPYFARRLPREDATAILTALSTNATVTELTVDVSGVATHPEGDVVLSTALTRPRIACGAAQSREVRDARRSGTLADRTRRREM